MSRLNQQRINAQDFDPERLNHPDPINDFQSSLTLEQPLFAQKHLSDWNVNKEAQRKK